MTADPVKFFFDTMGNLLLYGASRLVACEKREDWRREWRGEWWHVRRAKSSICGHSLKPEFAKIEFCLGAFQDAWCLRPQFSACGFIVHRSAMECVASLATLVGALALIAHSVPGVRAEEDTLRYRVRPKLLLIQDGGSNQVAIPAVSQRMFVDWRITRQRYFDALAYYRSAREEVRINEKRSVRLQVGHASSNFLQLLDIPVLFAARNVKIESGAVLSHRAWIEKFGGDPSVAGKTLQIGKRTIQIAGVTPSSSLILPTDPDLWLLNASGATENEGANSGFVIAHLSPRGWDASDAQAKDLPIATALDDADPDQPALIGIALSDRAAGIDRIGRFALFLAFLALPAVVSVSLNESNFSTYRPSWKTRTARVLFLAIKLVLVSAAAHYASLIAAYGFFDGYVESAELLQFVASFSLSLLGLRWALLDQCHRCPVCLRHVTHPARVGQFSQTFLGWNGTEMFCAGGHTLLHVPVLPTSWFHSPRWVYLDPSWQSLFRL